MSVPTTEPVVAPVGPATHQPKTSESPQDGPKVEVFDAEYVSKLRGENARYRTEAKAQADAAAKAQEVNKTDAQKLADLTDRFATSERLRVRAEIAQTKGVPAALLTGDNVDELTASADALIAFRGETPKVPGTPKPDLTQGGQGTAPALNSDGLEEALRAKLGI